MTPSPGTILDFAEDEIYDEAVVVVVLHTAALFVHVHLAEVHAKTVPGFIRGILAALVFLGDERKVVFIDTRAVVADPDLDEALTFAVFLRNIVGH